MACKLIGTYVFLALLGIATCVKNDETDQECIKNDEGPEPEVTEEKKLQNGKKCWERHLQNDQDGMDALCEGTLVCAKKGHGKPKRNFGCEDYYCCSKDKSGKDEGQMNPEEVLDDGETLDTLFKQKEDEAAVKKADEKTEDEASEKKAEEKTEAPHVLPALPDEDKAAGKKAQGGAEGGATTTTAEPKPEEKKGSWWWQRWRRGEAVF
jgi:hypothetical protein